MFEIYINEYCVKPLVISKYTEKFFMERLFNEISKFEFKEKHIYKTSCEENSNLCTVAVVLLIGEKDKKELIRKYKKLKTLCTDVTLSPYSIAEYPLPNEYKELPFPNYVLDNRVVESMEKFQLC